MEIKEEIQKIINNDLVRIKIKSQKEWIIERLIDPVVEKLSLDPDGKQFGDFWIVTQHKADKCYRIAYDANEKKFGIVTALDNNLEWFMGYYGTFADAVNGL